MDKKQRLEIAVTAVLVAAFVIAWLHTIRAIKLKSQPKPAEVAAIPVTRGVTPGKSTDKGFVELGQDRDPFSGRIYSAEQGSKTIALELRGIVWDKLKPRALIGDRIVKPGDVIGKYVVTKINKESVIVNDGERDIELRL